MSKIDELIAELCPDGVVHKELGDIIRKVAGANKKIAKSEIKEDGIYPVYTQGANKTPDGFSNAASAVISDTPVILYGDHTNVLKWIDNEFIAGADGVKLISADRNSGLDDRFLYYVLLDRVREISDGYARHFAKLRQLTIPVPPLKVQQAIVSVLDTFTGLEAELEAELEARKKQYEFYLNQLLNFDDTTTRWHELWELTSWDKKFNNMSKEMQPKVVKYPYVLANVFKNIEDENGNVRLLSTGINETIRMTTEDKAGKNLCEGEIVAIPWGGTPNVKYYKGKFVTADNRIATSNDITKLSNKFLYYWLQKNIETIASFYRGSGIKHPSMAQVLSLKIPVPPIEEQNHIVSILDKFDTLVSDISVGLPAELNARRKQYEYYRTKLLSFKELTHA